MREYLFRDAIYLLYCVYVAIIQVYTIYINVQYRLYNLINVTAKHKKWDLNAQWYTFEKKLYILFGVTVWKDVCRARVAE